MDAIKKLRRFAVVSILIATVSGMFNTGYAGAASTTLTLSDVKADVLAGRSLTDPERHLLAVTAAKVMGEDPALIEAIITLVPNAALALPVKEKTVASVTTTTITPVAIGASASATASSCVSGSSSRSGTRYSYNVTGSTVFRYKLTKNWDWSTCYAVANDNDFMSSDDIEGYVYGPFQWAWDFSGTTSHSGGNYSFNGFPLGGHSSLVRGKFKYCVSVPIIGTICPQTKTPWVKVNGHYEGSSAVYTGG